MVEKVFTSSYETASSPFKLYLELVLEKDVVSHLVAFLVGQSMIKFGTGDPSFSIYMHSHWIRYKAMGLS